MGEEKREVEQTGLGEIIRKIPGFKGYFSLEDRREADFAVRQTVTEEFQKFQKRFDSFQQELVDKSGLKHLELTQRINLKLQNMIDRIKTAPRVYRSLFDEEFIDDEILDSLIEFDKSLLGYIDGFATKLAELNNGLSGERIGEALRETLDLITQADETFSRRDAVILNIEA